jgi:hypothetical protein
VLAYILRRIAQPAVVMAAVAFVAFGHFAFAPVIAAWRCLIARAFVRLDPGVDLMCCAVARRPRVERATLR